MPLEKPKSAAAMAAMAAMAATVPTPLPQTVEVAPDDNSGGSF